MDSRIEVGDGGSKGSVCIRGNGGGSIELPVNVHAQATRSAVGGTANVATNRGTIDAEGRGDGSMRINGDSECEEEESGNEGLREHFGDC